MIVDTGSESTLPTEPMSLHLLGMRLVPEVISRTPPFIDEVQPNSPAHLQGIGSRRFDCRCEW